MSKLIDFLGELEVEIDRLGGLNECNLDLKKALKGFERALITETLQQNRWRIHRTAKILKIHPATLWKKMRALGIKKHVHI